MKLKVYYDGRYQDQFIIEGEDIEKIREIIYSECARRNWDTDDCWSETLD